MGRKLYSSVQVLRHLHGCVDLEWAYYSHHLQGRRKRTYPDCQVGQRPRQEGQIEQIAAFRICCNNFVTQGGTISVSNAGMYGLSQMISVINPPQAIILGVAKAEKKVLYDPKAQDSAQPFRVASVMTVWASVDHRLVDGALSAQYLSKVKKYL